MSEQINETARLKIEDDLAAALSGDTLKNALEYVACMKAKGFLPVDPNASHFESAGKYICQICIYPDNNIPGWTIFMGESYDDVLARSEYQNYPIDERLKEFAWSHVSTCGACGCGAQPGRRIMLWGREFNNVCTGLLSFRNPDGEALALTKRLTEVWAQSKADAAKKDKPYVPKENEWLSARGFGADTGRPLGKVYAKSLDVQFYITPRRRFVNNAAVGFSGGGWVPATLDQIPAALSISHNSRFGANKNPANAYDWAAVETLKFQANVTYFAEMSLNITNKTYSVMVWMLDANGEKDTPYSIAKDFPFRLGSGDPAVPAITAIDTVYLGQDNDNILAFVVRDFKVVGGE
jgi:hypothetical protein